MAAILPINATNNITGMYSFFQYVNNDITNGLFFLLILAALFIITFISLKDYRAAQAFTMAAFMNFVFSLILRILGFIQNKWIYLAAIILAFAVVWLHTDNQGGRL